MKNRLLAASIISEKESGSQGVRGVRSQGHLAHWIAGLRLWPTAIWEKDPGKPLFLNMTLRPLMTAVHEDTHTSKSPSLYLSFKRSSTQERVVF
jgi:hypothetical protein